MRRFLLASFVAVVAMSLISANPASALSGFRYRALPGWTAWICAIAAVCQLPAFGAGVTQTGAFAGDGALGLFLPIFSFLVGLVAISIALMRSPAPGAASVPSG